MTAMSHAFAFALGMTVPRLLRLIRRLWRRYRRWLRRRTPLLSAGSTCPVCRSGVLEFRGGWLRCSYCGFEDAAR